MERCSDWIHRQTFGTLNSSSYTFKTTMLKKRQPDANSPQIKFLINPYIHEIKIFLKHLYWISVEACEPLCYIIKMLHMLNTKG